MQPICPTCYEHYAGKATSATVATHDALCCNCNNLTTHGFAIDIDPSKVRFPQPDLSPAKPPA